MHRGMGTAKTTATARHGCIDAGMYGGRERQKRQFGV